MNAELMGINRYRDYLKESSRVLKLLESYSVSKNTALVNHYILFLRPLVKAMGNIIGFMISINKFLGEQETLAINFTKELATHCSKAIDHIQTKVKD